MFQRFSNDFSTLLDQEPSVLESCSCHLQKDRTGWDPLVQLVSTSQSILFHLKYTLQLKDTGGLTGMSQEKGIWTRICMRYMRCKTMYTIYGIR